LAVVIAVASYFARDVRRAPHQPGTPDTPVVSGRPASPDSNELSSLIRSGRSGVVVQSSGTIVKALPDDLVGDRHQRFLVRIASGETVLIAHNIDIAARVPLSDGGAVRFKGEFEFNDRGGVVHWTHRDPRRGHPDGWIEMNGRRYD